MVEREETSWTRREHNALGNLKQVSYTLQPLCLKHVLYTRHVHGNSVGTRNNCLREPRQAARNMRREDSGSAGHTTPHPSGKGDSLQCTSHC